MTPPRHATYSRDCRRWCCPVHGMNLAAHMYRRRMAVKPDQMHIAWAATLAAAGRKG